MTRGSVLILAGGTGGHVYPALAVAEVLREQQCALYWLGTRSGLEADVARRAGIPFFVVPIKGLRRAGMLRWLSAPLLLIWATLRALVHVIHLRPDVVLGMGGFVSGPAGIAAWFCRRPLIIHEQNAVAGLTNRILARFATRALAGFPRSFPAVFSVHFSILAEGDFCLLIALIFDLTLKKLERGSGGFFSRLNIF